ncbi:MAG: hypothetical protein ACI97A_001828 [Planctomycetota bacterium]|jgi:hypothetical protein
MDLLPLGDASDFEKWPYVDRRNDDDRRGVPTGIWDSLFSKGSRASGRRLGEDKNIYVDLYGRREIVLVILILVLNILDAFFTLDYLEKGGKEANPVAQGLLDLGNTWFICAKSFLVGICLAFLLVHKKFSYVDMALGLLCAFYSLLLCYHGFLQVRFYITH